MNNWIEKFKKLAISSYKPHIIVADLDSLFSYDEVRQAFEEEGYKILDAESGLKVRMLFELQVRYSEEKYLIVTGANYFPLPDLEADSHFESIGLAKLFPNLDSKAIKGLSFNALCLLSNTKMYEILSHENTLRFLLENLYNVDLNTLTNSKAKERVLNALISVLLEKNGINQSLTMFLNNISKPYFPELTKSGLTKINLIEFIQQQWNLYVDGKGSLLDFKEPLLNKSLGYLFALEYLKPVKVTSEKYSGFFNPLKIGIYVDEQGHNDSELEGLTKYLKQQLEIIEDIPDQWFKIIQVFANAKIKYLLSSNTELKKMYCSIENLFNTRFQRFIDNTYGSLFSLSGVRRPVVVSRILEHIRANPAKKRALLVIDGMNYWQWILLGKSLAKDGLTFESSASLAFIPTITAWSRQAIFKGDKPDISQDNSEENKLFRSFWLKDGVPSFNLEFMKFDVNMPLIVSHISSDKTILGLVCNDLDKIMHGSILGDLQLKSSTEQWITKSNIVRILSELRSNGFKIFVTSDHGNVEATGTKNLTIKEKVGSISRGKRHLHLDNETLQNTYLEQNPDLELGTRGLSVYMKNREAFTTENTVVVTHGGSHFWEVIVPFISINE